MNRNDVIDECIKCCNLQQLINDNESDRGYFNAVRDCVNALKALKNAAPQGPDLPVKDASKPSADGRTTPAVAAP